MRGRSVDHLVDEALVHIRLQLGAAHAFEQHEAHPAGDALLVDRNELPPALAYELGRARRQAGAGDVFIDVVGMNFHGNHAVLNDPANAPVGEVQVSLTSLEAPSNYLALRLEMEALRHDLRMAVSVAGVPKPDPRLPVEEDTFLVDGIEMSNFVHPAWFEPFKHPRGTKFDHLGLLEKPFSMTKGGYMIIKKKGKVSEVFGSKAKAKRFAQEDRRGHRSEYRKPKGLRIEKRGRR